MKLFSETGLSPEVLQAVTDLGFDTPTPIQAKTIPVVLNSFNDIVALAQTGTGKTAAFGLPMLEVTDTFSKEIQFIILCPTRELCIQIGSEMKKYGKYIKGVSIVEVYGGADISKQIKSIRKGAHIIVGTPGRVLDLINRGTLDLSAIKWVVLDEADEMLNMGFKEDLNQILKTTPKTKRTLLFSATMPKEILDISAKYMTDPIEITVDKRNSAAINVEHEYYVVHSRDRYEALKRISDMNPGLYAIVFCRTRRETKELASKLINDGYNSEALHGDLSQAQRDEVMTKFRNKKIQMLVATDVAARGLDVSDVSHVINIDLPEDLEVYIHRSGRTGRAGKQGLSISIINTRELKYLKELEKLAGINFSRKKVPGGKEICEKQLFNLVRKVVDTKVDEEKINPFLPDIMKMFDGIDREEIIKRLVAEEFQRFLDYYKKSYDINVTSDSYQGDYGKSDRSSRGRDRGDKGRGRERGSNNRSSEGFSKFTINVGKKDGINPVEIIQMINRSLNVRNVPIGKIDIQKTESTVEIDSKFGKDISRKMQNITYRNLKINVRMLESRGGTASKSDSRGGYKNIYSSASGKGVYDKSSGVKRKRSKYIG